MVCSHTENASLAPPSAYAQVHKEECTQCFDNQVNDLLFLEDNILNPFCSRMDPRVLTFVCLALTVVV